LSISEFRSRVGTSPADIQTLTGIITIELVKTGKYAVLPRNAAIQKAMTEQTVLGQAANAVIVLNGEIGVLGSNNIFSAQLLRTDGSLVIGDNINYKDIAEGIILMPELAIRLTEPDFDIAQRKIAEHQRNVKMKQEAELAAAADARRAQEEETEKERIQRETEARKIQKEADARAKKEKRKEARQNTLENARRNEWETFSVSFVQGQLPSDDGELIPHIGVNFNIFLSGFYWSILPFTNIGIESGVTLLTEGHINNIDLSTLDWFFNVSPTIGVIYPLGSGARIYANAVFDFGKLPAEGKIQNWSITDDFGIGCTPGFSTGFSFGNGGTFTLEYRVVWYKNTYTNSFGLGFGKFL
jgi:hypothetical protein